MSIKLGGRPMGLGCGEGNRIFPLFTAIIYGHKHNLFLCKPSCSIECVNINFELFNKNKCNNKNLDVKKLNHSNFDKKDELMFYGNKLYIFTDYFQNANYLNNNYDIIMKYVTTKEIIKPPIYNNIHKNDILCILRMGEMNNYELVGADYFISIFKKHNFNKIYFLIYPYNKNDIEKYLKQLNNYKDKIVLLKNKNKLEDFYCVNYFNYVATSISTFNWWSIFFMNTQNKTIYTPKYLGCYENPLRYRPHCKNLCNIKNSTIPIENIFINI